MELPLCRIWTLPFLKMFITWSLFGDSVAIELLLPHFRTSKKASHIRMTTNRWAMLWCSLEKRQTIRCCIADGTQCQLSHKLRRCWNEQSGTRNRMNILSWKIWLWCRTLRSILCVRSRFRQGYSVLQMAIFKTVPKLNNWLYCCPRLGKRKKNFCVQPVCHLAWYFTSR